MLLRTAKRTVAVVGLGVALGAFLMGAFHAHQARPELSGGQGCELCLLHGGTPALMTAAVADPQGQVTVCRLVLPVHPALASIRESNARPRAPPHA